MGKAFEQIYHQKKKKKGRLKSLITFHVGEAIDKQALSYTAEQGIDWLNLYRRHLAIPLINKYIL